MKVVFPLCLAASLFAGAALAEVPRVAATTKPVHALVAAVMGEVGEPTLIVRGSASPHTYSLRPSDAGALQQADIVFWTGPGMELFLEAALAALAVKAQVVELAESPGIALLPLREGGAFEAHDEGEAHAHEHGHEHEGHEARDMHYWLDPANAAHMVEAIAATLVAADPEHAASYEANAAAEIAALGALGEAIEVQLAPVRAVPFVVFHDAYQYFERRFGLNVAGSITVTPDSLPGAARIAEIRARLAGEPVACVFAEPQFEPAIVNTVIEGSAARAGTLDPEGATLEPGPGLYAALLRGLADSLVDCLDGH
jgi:zinc transport system substrate-binding protein